MIEPGERLLNLAATSRSEFVMCAPFAKQSIVTKLLAVLPTGIRPVLYTRWRPDEVAAGVSDTEVLTTIQSRDGVVYLHDRLHAKFFRNDAVALIGSANLTGAALGWALNPNLELLVESNDGDVLEIERLLGHESILATEEIASEVERIARLLPGPVQPPDAAVTEAPDVDWVPSLRIPSDLYTAYSKGAGSLASQSGARAVIDLAVLDLPVGLDRDQFQALVGHRLLNQPLFRTIDDFLGRPRRFGEVRAMISQRTGFDRDDAEEAWQTIMRWMLEFLPERYVREAHRHSEVVSRTKDTNGAAR